MKEQIQQGSSGRKRKREMESNCSYTLRHASMAGHAHNIHASTMKVQSLILSFMCVIVEHEFINNHPLDTSKYVSTTYN